ncbi:MAG: hypothetical protein K1X85_04520 [Ignavibacteria bacterium]|nr:hypothetical protein [Ignavibacteria bacterium]
MKSSDEIFRLIKSMTKKERNFFRKKMLPYYSDDGNYLKLFDEIAAQADEGDAYDESKVKGGDYAGKFIKNLSVHKNYMYGMLLESLRLCNANKPAVELRNMISEAQILFDKLLFDQSLKLIRKAMKIAQEKNVTLPQYDLINLERNILKYTSTVEEYSEKSSALFDSQYEVLKQCENTVDFYRLNEAAGVFLRSFGAGRVRDEKQMMEFDRTFNNPLLKDESEAKTFQSRYIFFLLNMQRSSTLEKWEEAYDYAMKATKLWEDNPSMLDGPVENYIFSLSNLINASIRAGKHDETEMALEKFRSLPEKFPDTITDNSKVFIFYSHSVHEISHYMMRHRIKELTESIERISSSIAGYENSISLYQRIILYYFLSAGNFMLENFDKCTYWNARIFNLEKSDLSEDYQCYARIIQLISFYELGYFDSLEYALRSAYHFFSKRKKLYRFEKIIQQYLRRSFRLKSEKEFLAMLEEMKYEIDLLADDSYEKNAFDAFDIRPWIISKLNGVSIHEAALTLQSKTKRMQDPDKRKR